MGIFKNILFATDLTDNSFKISQEALKIAKQNSAEFNILHVVNNIPIYTVGYIGIPDLEQSILAFSATRPDWYRHACDFCD